MYTYALNIRSMWQFDYGLVHITHAILIDVVYSKCLDIKSYTKHWLLLPSQYR